MYWSYKRMKAECERNPPCHVGGFTRLLSSKASAAAVQGGRAALPISRN